MEGESRRRCRLPIAQRTGEVTITRVERKETVQEPPLLYDLTTLQKEANTKHSFSADKTLSIAQKLYEAKADYLSPHG